MSLKTEQKYTLLESVLVLKLLRKSRDLYGKHIKFNSTSHWRMMWPKTRSSDSLWAELCHYHHPPARKSLLAGYVSTRFNADKREVRKSSSTERTLLYPANLPASGTYSAQINIQLKWLSTRTSRESFILVIEKKKKRICVRHFSCVYLCMYPSIIKIQRTYTKTQKALLAKILSFFLT